jgi:hypothetical protein
MNLSIVLLIIIIVVVVFWLFSNNKNSQVEFLDTNTHNLSNKNGLCPSCPNQNVTCKDAANQTFYNDPRCLNTSSDPHMGLGCIGTTGCRYCGFGVYSPVQCPTTVSPPVPSVPPTPSPVHPPVPPSGNFKVNLVNECPVTVLAAALGPTKIKPTDNRSWVLKPGEKLSLDIPKEWENTAGISTINGPRFWARTGCVYDEKLDMASCAGGDCGNKYDCSNSNMAGSPPGSWAEFCFNCGDGLTYYDVSLVDGAHMSMDIKPENPSSMTHPGNPSDPFWCKTNLCNKGQDLRDSSYCPKDFQFLASDLKSYNPNTGSDTSVIACFSNCGKWAYKKGLLGGNVKCDPNKPEPKNEDEVVCQNWRKYCCQSPSSGSICKTDSDCKFGEACWNGTCQCRAYYRKPCDPNICTHPYCECNDSQTSIENFSTTNLSNNTRTNNKFTNKYLLNTPKSCGPSVCPQGFSTQPKPTICTDEQGCIGDDVLHQVCPQAYTWPNDPQTYNCDAKEYTVTFCPGGTSVPMLDSISGIPDCSSFKQFPEYKYEQALLDCSGSINSGNAYACARKDGPWACGIDKNASCYNLGALCKFNQSSKS